MELRHLRYFVAVASELNFSRAAEKSLVAQPALSTQIADLEREIGTPLLFRNKRVVRLTAAGAVFLKEAQAILEAADSAKVNALRASRGEFGELSIGFFAAPTMLFLPDLIRRFRAKYPDVTIRMLELTPDKQLAALENGEISVGFTRPLPSGHPDLVTQTLFRERLVAVVAETHPLASHRRVRLSDLAEEPFVLLDRRVATSLYDHIIVACSSAGFSTPDHQQSRPDGNSLDTGGCRTGYQYCARGCSESSQPTGGLPGCFASNRSDSTDHMLAREPRFPAARCIFATRCRTNSGHSTRVRDPVAEAHNSEEETMGLAGQ